MQKTKPARVLAAEVLSLIAERHFAMHDAMDKCNVDAHAEKSFIRALVFETLRYYESAQAILRKYLKKSIRHKDSIVQYALQVGIVECLFFNTAEYACVNAHVNAMKAWRKQWANGLVNAILRQVLRDKTILLSQLEVNLPSWLIEEITRAWPEQAKHVMVAMVEHRPLCVRVNRQQATRSEFVSALLTHPKIICEQCECTDLQLQNLSVQCVNCQANYTHIVLPDEAPDCVVLSFQLTNAISLKNLPGFESGWFSVQDIGAQFAAPLLELQENVSVLDACAAPGGKTTHMLELVPHLQCLAIDVDDTRLEKVRENVTRLKLNGDNIDLQCQDASDENAWENDTQFDRILLDAPCSAIGIIARHPDIKLLRAPEQIASLVHQQFALLNTLWSRLKTGGVLLYATCSILPAENDDMIARFLSQTQDAQCCPISVPGAPSTQYGMQCLPGISNTDGFYYAKLKKHPFPESLKPAV